MNDLQSCKKKTCQHPPPGYYNGLENQDSNFNQHDYGMVESHINIVGNEANLEVIATEATEDVSGDEANLEMNIATIEHISRDDTNLEVLAIIAEDVSKIDYAKLFE